MIHSFINMTLLPMTFLFSLIKHPLSMGLMLLLQTLIICLIIGNTHNSFWFSYILFLIFLGGLLVLFIYVVSLASNEMFNFSIKLSMIFFLLLMSLMIINLFIDNMQLDFIYNDTMYNSNFNNLNKENYKIIYKLYNFPTNLITLLLINYLFFSLIVIVKVTNFHYGPLRHLN